MEIQVGNVLFDQPEEEEKVQGYRQERADPDFFHTSNNHPPLAFFSSTVQIVLLQRQLVGEIRMRMRP